MSKKILLIVIGIALLGVVLGSATSFFAAPLATDNDGIGNGKALIIFGSVIYGTLGIVASTLVGTLYAKFGRRSNRQVLTMLAYLVPSLLAFFIVLWGFISVVFLGNPSPY